MKIEIKNLTKSFKKAKIIDNVNVVFESGKIYGIIGPNGSGKSVFLKLLCGFYMADSGKIIYDGVEFDSKNSFPPISTRALIEKPDFIPELTGWQNLKLLADIQNKITDEEILTAMKNVNIFTEKDKKYGKYSLGMKQKLGIAQVIMENPNIMIFDEPLNGIEQETAEKFRCFLKNCKKNKIIIVASHIKEDIKYLCDEVYKFKDGNLVKINEKEFEERI